MQQTEPPISFEEALAVLRDGVDDTYGDRVTASNELYGVMRDNDLPGVDVVRYPRTEEAIWRYQHHDEEAVRSAIQASITQKDFRGEVDTVVASLREAATILKEA